MTQTYFVEWSRPHRNGHPCRHAALLGRTGLKERWRGSRGTLFATDDLPLRMLSGRSGVVVGPLFDRLGHSAPSVLPNRNEHFDSAAFVRDRWGSYIAFVETNERLSVLRDPSGGLPCYRTSQGEHHYVTSAPHLLFECGILAPMLDWTMIAEALARHDQRRGSTCLTGVSELPPGNLLELSQGASAESEVWNARKIAAGGGLEGSPEQLEHALTSSLGAWGTLAARPVIEISGGLDSAIVAAGVAGSSPGATLLTFAPSPGDADETGYAQAVADHLGLPLQVVCPDVADVDLTLSLSARLPRPNARAFTQAGDALSLAYARSVGADAFFSGGGGDDVFCYLRSVLPAIDRWRCEGLRAMAITALDVARTNHATLWEVFHRLVQRAMAPRVSGERLDTRFMSVDCSAALPAPAAPADAVGLLPGKARHVDGIATIHNYLEGHGRASFAPIVSPLLSQPIVEACLAIPTWRWCEHGRNRAAARAAFETKLPRVILDRRSKGSFDGFCARLLDRNRDLIWDMLSDGRLVSQGLLDLPAISSALHHPSPPAGSVSRLLAIVDVESWVRAWTRPQHQLG